MTLCESQSLRLSMPHKVVVMIVKDEAEYIYCLELLEGGEE